MSVKTMWAQSLVAPSTFKMQEVLAPTEDDLNEGEVLIRVLAGGVCGSDIPFFRGQRLPSTSADRPFLPPALGCPLHEVAGEVIASRDSAIESNSRVVGWANNFNAMSEFAIVKGVGVYKYDPNLTPSNAILLQPLACVIHALEQFSYDVAGKTAAVIGLGPIGVLFSHVLKNNGATRIIGIDRVDRSDVADAFLIDDPVQATSDGWAATVGEERPDVIIEAVGHQVTTLMNAIHALAVGGGVYYFGIPDDEIYPFPMMTFLRKNARLASGVTREENRRPSLAKADAYVSKHKELQDNYITDHFGFNEAQAAFDLAAAPSRGRLKIVFEAGI